ncbi:hypothetical protein J2858_001297 [Neorhizobium galegae]|uniref:hypothetical protein n=1 Tax=Neorhizobium galegae TaxID=399 RepID=UPI001AE795D7|nr:hypothetical protein [Neorhizobium galegae]MBP2548404.1 hypothetical protein [Neorhizobium galegae]
MAFFFRFLSLLALVLAIAAGTVDAVLSVSSSSVVLTSLEADWVAVDPGSLTLVEAWINHYIHPQAWQSGLAVIIQQPAFAIFLALSLLLWMIGYRRATLGASSA